MKVVKELRKLNNEFKELKSSLNLQNNGMVLLYPNSSLMINNDKLIFVKKGPLSFAKTILTGICSVEELYRCNVKAHQDQ